MSMDLRTYVPDKPNSYLAVAFSPDSPCAISFLCLFSSVYIVDRSSPSDRHMCFLKNVKVADMEHVSFLSEGKNEEKN